MAISTPVTYQAAAIPIHDDRICLVTSRRTQGWIIPKGTIEPGESPAETALREAWEEAGLLGSLHSEPVGTYYYQKCGRDCRVTVYLMQVEAAAEQWPERHQRARRWATSSEVIVAIQQPILRKLIVQGLGEHALGAIA
jgi:8-oxo-dGTP pyrophosphatase MutT (NUDIX family)